MAFDGITVSAVVNELSSALVGGRLFKIAQPEPDELFITVKNNKSQYKLMISANPSLPLVYFTNTGKQAPLTAPVFCMLLRKHINNGRIISITQPSLERIIDMEIEHLNEMGDLCRKHLVIELMGKYSNIIFCDENKKIIDSIKHIPAHISSVREVLPGRDYFIPDALNKISIYDITEEYFLNNICIKNLPCSKALYTGITGFSPLISEEICYRSSIDSSIPVCELSDAEKVHLYNMISLIIDDIKNHIYSYTIYYKNNEPTDFSVIPLSMCANDKSVTFENVSSLLEKYYSEKNMVSRMRQRSADLRQIVQTALSKDYKKYNLQLKQLNDTSKREKYKIYGELITAYGYQLEDGSDKLICENYYDNNNEITIPLDKEKSPIDNAKTYFEKYNKLKRTFEALTTITKETENEINHLESVKTSLDLATTEDDLKEIKEELVQYNFIKRKSSDKKSRFKSVPLHFKSSGGHDIYVGKNNFQNEELTFHVATGNDMWFHAKGLPGSHVIVKTNGDELTDAEYEEAGRLAAHFSKANHQKTSSEGMAAKIEVDYIEKKHVKKANGGAPGFVIYHTNYSMLIDGNIEGIEEVK